MCANLDRDPIARTPHSYKEGAVRKAIVTGGVSYHDALARPAQPFADVDALDVHELPRHELEAYGLLVVLRSVDGEPLWACVTRWRASGW